MLILLRKNLDLHTSKSKHSNRIKKSEFCISITDLILFFHREVLFSLDESEKIFGGNYGSSNAQWKHYKVQIKPSRYEKQVPFWLFDMHYTRILFQLTFLSSINPTNGSIGYDNILFTSQKKCLPKWISLYGYKFHQDIATDNFYKMMFQPRY